MSMTHAEILAVVQAAKEGKPIQYRHITTSEDDLGSWRDDDRPPHRPDFNFYSYDYRIKPEPPTLREYKVMLCPDRNDGMPEIFGVKYYAGSCDKCQTFIVREVLPEEQP